MNYEIILVTNNKNKIREVREILCPHGIIVYGLNDLNIHIPEPEENGSTYYENALIKAKSIQHLTTMPIIADDSGFEVEALNNEPGLYSARYAAKYGGYKEAMEHIINELKDKDNKRAKFICDIVLLNVEDKPLLFEGIVEGVVANQLEGEGGFGYDPCFISNETGKTYANMSEGDKNKTSHRGKALKKLLTYLRITGKITI